MRELIEDLWPELVHKLPPKNRKPDDDRYSTRKNASAGV